MRTTSSLSKIIGSSARSRPLVAAVAVAALAAGASMAHAGTGSWNGSTSAPTLSTKNYGVQTAVMNSGALPSGAAITNLFWYSNYQGVPQNDYIVTRFCITAGCTANYYVGGTGNTTVLNGYGAQTGVSLYFAVYDKASAGSGTYPAINPAAYSTSLAQITVSYSY